MLVQICEEPEPDAMVFADVLTKYNDETGTFSESNGYIGKKSVRLGEYHTDIPISPAEESLDYGEICDSIEMALSDACHIYSKVNKYAL